MILCIGESENKFSSNSSFIVENKSESSSEAESISITKLITKLRNESLHKVDCLTPQK